MLFNSYTFLFGFLPLVLVVAFALARLGNAAVIAWLALASLVFYGWWNWHFVPLLAVSIAFNLAAAQGIARSEGRASRAWLAVAVAANLLFLGYFKYAGFFAETLDALAGTHWRPPAAALPLGISFFTFTQIAFLVDLHRRLARPLGGLRYTLFVTFFPHLIAGPLYHHAQVVPQFERRGAFRFDATNLHLGLVLLAIGLFKKCVVADNLAPIASGTFDLTASGYNIGALAAWTATLAYGFQIYFDFSGYSDMALGLARMLGIRLPVNFASPYKATSVIEFWRRWHMTLSAFLRDYLYIPLGGNRKGPARRYVNLLLTMVLGGLWHGAAWTFVLWGAFHGAMLCVNHLWESYRARRGAAAGRIGMLGAGALTFAGVMTAWVLFRATSLQSAWIIYRGAFGVYGRGELPELAHLGWLAFAAAVVFVLRNSNEYVAALENAAQAPARTLRLGAAAVGAMLFMALAAMVRSEPSPFLYFNF